MTVTEVNPSSETVTLNGRKLAWPRSRFAAMGNYVVTVTDKPGHKVGYKFKI